MPSEHVAHIALGTALAALVAGLIATRPLAIGFTVLVFYAASFQVRPDSSPLERSAARSRACLPPASGRQSS